MQFSNDVTQVTRELIVPKVYDQVTKGSPLLMLILQNAKGWKSGIKYDVPIQHADTTNGGVTGLADALDTNRENVLKTMAFEPKMAYKPVVIADLERVLNSGDERIIDLVETEFDIQGKSLSTLMAQYLYNGTGVGNAWDSLDNAADDSTNYASYGGLARATYTKLKGYYLASAGALTLNKLATAYDAVEIGQDAPTVLVTTKSLWSTYEGLLTPTQRMNYSGNGYPRMNAFGMVPKAEGFGANAGFNVLHFRGTPVVKDEQCPSGRLYLVNTNYFGFKGIDLTGIDENGKKKYEQLNFKKTGSDGTPAGVPGRIPSTKGFNFRVFMSPVNQLTEVGYLLYQGNFISEMPRTQGQMRDLT